MKIKNVILFAMIAATALFSASCSKDDDNTPQPKQSIQVVMVNDLPADPATRDPNTGEVIGGTNQFTFFRFSDSTIVPNSDSASAKWDIGFRGTTVILNSGINGPGHVGGRVAKSTLNEVTKAPEGGYLMDGEEGNVFGEWYNYNMQKHVITPKPGYIFIIKTNDDKYVKMEVLSYYKGAPADATSADETRYYTFRYVIQPDGSRDFTSDVTE